MNAELQAISVIVFSPLTASRATLALKGASCCFRIGNIIPYLLVKDMAGLDAPKPPVQFLGTTSGASERDRTSDLLITNQLA